jgi:hypothetical protein
MSHEHAMLQEVVQCTGRQFWDFLELKEVLNLSVASKVTEALVLPPEKLNQTVTFSSWNPQVTLKFPHSITVGMYRRVLYNLHHVQELTVQIDDRNGRILLDIGSAVHGQDQDNGEEEEGDLESQQIFKHLEHFSCDEYDDFNPRHPVPKDRAHRRGDSYFNSDIEMVVGELGNQVTNQFDLTSIVNKLNAPAAAGAGAQGSTSGPKSAKDRILAKTKNNIPGRPKPTRAVNALNDGSGEEN